MDVDHYELALCLVGIAALMAAWVPPYLARRPLSLPIILVLVGWVIGAVGLGLPAVDPRGYPAVTERLTELGVIIALMGAGLKIDRPFGRRSWASTGRMVLVAMPITIALIAALGLAVGALGLGLSGPARRGAGTDRPGPRLRRPGG